MNQTTGSNIRSGSIIGEAIPNFVLMVAFAASISGLAT